MNTLRALDPKPLRDGGFICSQWLAGMHDGGVLSFRPRDRFGKQGGQLREKIVSHSAVTAVVLQR